jgi:hypothetical protein
MLRSTRWAARLFGTSRLVALTVALLVVSTAWSAQKGKAEVCPWCKNDPELLRKAGLVSHGPMPIGNTTSGDLSRDLPAGLWIFLESTHFRWASALPAIDIEIAEQERVQGELDRLRAVLPGVPQKVRRLDPWLRLHLIAMKGEEFYTRFQKLLDVKDADFPESRKSDGPFMGDGRFLGEKDKFEVVLHSNRMTHNMFTRTFSGAQVTGALRWGFKTPCKMLASIPCEDPDLKKDRWLFPHIVHNLSHLFYCAYKHFSYDPPVWIDEGIALAMEKEIEPRSATNEGEEGTYRDAKTPADWFEAVRKMLTREKEKSVAELMYKKEVGSMDQDALFTSWSMARYLIDEHGGSLAKFLGGLKGQLDEKGIPSGKDLPGLQRNLMKECFGWTPQALDEAWKAWAARPAAK